MRKIHILIIPKRFQTLMSQAIDLREPSKLDQSQRILHSDQHEFLLLCCCGSPGETIIWSMVY